MVTAQSPSSYHGYGPFNFTIDYFKANISKISKWIILPNGNKKVRKSVKDSFLTDWIQLVGKAGPVIRNIAEDEALESLSQSLMDGRT